jgi:large subunit ribosomal protein L23
MAKDILIKPLISEKFTKLTEKYPNKYGFVVHADANKIEIKNAIEGMYGVTVEKVNTSILPRKQRSRFTRSGILKGRTKLVKRAIVTLHEEDAIDFFESI